MASRNITFTIDTHAYVSSMRAVSRSIRQMQRNRATRPVSAERLEIQRIGQREMAAALAWFQGRIAEDHR